MFDILEEYLCISEEALNLAIAVGGYNEETAQRILCSYTGWSSFEGFLGELCEEEDEDF